MLEIPLQSNLNEMMDSEIVSILTQIAPEMPHHNFIMDLAIIMLIGTVVTLALFKVKQPMIMGYLVGGMLIGPLSPLWSSFFASERIEDGSNTIGLISDLTSLNLFSEIGVILLLFVIGIEFPYAKIRAIGKVAVGIGTIGLLLTLGLVFLAATAMGLTFMDSLFLGAALSISSTAVIVKILTDMGKIKKEFSLMVLGVLIVEDVIAVILLSMLHSVALVGDVSVWSVASILIVAAVMIVGTLTIGTRIIPPLIDRVAKSGNKEILLLNVLGLCFGYSLLTQIVGLSVPIGAFLAGVLVAESKSAETSKLLSSPIKDMFVAIFFVSVGALMDVNQISSYLALGIVLLLVSVMGKFGGHILGNIAFRRKRPGYIRSASTLAAPRGEFSIVIAKMGVDMGVVSSFVFPLVGFIMIITTLMSSFIINAGLKVAERSEKNVERT